MCLSQGAARIALTNQGLSACLPNGGASRTQAMYAYASLVFNKGSIKALQEARGGCSVCYTDPFSLFFFFFF